MQKLSLHVMVSNSQRGLPQRLSQKCLALIIPKSNKLLQRIKSSCPNSEKTRSTKTTQNNSGQLRATQNTHCYCATHKKASTFHTPSCTVARPLIKSSASLGPSQRSPRALSLGHGDKPRTPRLADSDVRVVYHTDKHSTPKPPERSYSKTTIS